MVVTNQIVTVAIMQADVLSMKQHLKTTNACVFIEDFGHALVGLRGVVQKNIALVVYTLTVDVDKVEETAKATQNIKLTHLEEDVVILNQNLNNVTVTEIATGQAQVTLYPMYNIK